MVEHVRWDLVGVDASWCASAIDGSGQLGYRPEERVTPASVMKIQVALAVASAIDSGTLDGTARIRLETVSRTPGPVGMSLMADPVEMSLRDLLVPMITISDNAATDALIDAVGLESVNEVTRRLGLTGTGVVEDLQGMLDKMAAEIGFMDYAALVEHDPAMHGPPTQEEVSTRLAASSPLDPARGSRTTPADMVRLLSLIWTDAAGPAPACARLRSLMRNQLTRHRIASGFGSKYSVSAKSGGLMGIVRNEVGVVTDTGGRSFAVAIFTRRDTRSANDPSEIDSAIGVLARRLVAQLQATSR